MEQNIENPIEKTERRGGARPGAGRPKGAKNHISVAELLTSLEIKSNGQRYEDILVDDFLAARNEGDKQTTLKYHNLILNKVMNTLAKVELEDSADAVAAKQAAFAEALAKLTGISQEINPEDTE